jgi:hypothetical protein
MIEGKPVAVIGARTFGGSNSPKAVTRLTTRRREELSHPQFPGASLAVR